MYKRMDKTNENRQNILFISEWNEEDKPGNGFVHFEVERSNLTV